MPAADQLFHADGYHHDLGEAIRRIATAFRYVLIDHARGEEWVWMGHDKLVRLNAPSVILEGHLSMRRRTAHVSVADDEGCAQFYLVGGEDIEIAYLSERHRESCRRVVRKLAEILGYELIDEPEAGPAGQAPPTP